MDIKIEMLPVAERDAALGRYMDAFGRLDGLVSLTIRFLLKIDHLDARALDGVIYFKQKIELLESLAALHLPIDLAKGVASTCGRLSRRNMRRNHIVHGAWQQLVEVYDDRCEMFWIRAYQPSNPGLASLGVDDPKLLGVYNFTVPALDRATDHVEEMLGVMSALMTEIREMLPPRPPRGESPDPMGAAQ